MTEAARSASEGSPERDSNPRLPLYKRAPPSAGVSPRRCWWRRCFAIWRAGSYCLWRAVDRLVLQIGRSGSRGAGGVVEPVGGQEGVPHAYHPAATSRGSGMPRAACSARSSASPASPCRVRPIRGTRCPEARRICCATPEDESGLLLALSSLDGVRPTGESRLSRQPAPGLLAVTLTARVPASDGELGAEDLLQHHVHSLGARGIEAKPRRVAKDHGDGSDCRTNQLVRSTAACGSEPFVGRGTAGRVLAP